MSGNHELISSTAVTWQHDSLEQAARTLAARLGLGVGPTDNTRFMLRVSDDGLCLRDLCDAHFGGIRVDFLSGYHRHRTRHGGGRKQALGRAFGLRRGRVLRVLDATAGLGKDGFVLADLGCTVTLCERCAVLAALLEDALARAAADPELGAGTASRLVLWKGDSRDLLKDRRINTDFDAVYLDPMYPERRSSALVKAELRMIRALVGVDSDSGDLLHAALEANVRRVVVKRPLRAPALRGLAPSHRVRSAATRYDVYVSNAG